MLSKDKNQNKIKLPKELAIVGIGNSQTVQLSSPKLTTVDINAYQIGKKAIYHQLELPLKKAYKYTSKVMSENMMTLDAKEGISSFLEKRKPNWKNK